MGYVDRQGKPTNFAVGYREKLHPRRQESRHILSGVTLHAEYEAQGLAQVSDSSATASTARVVMKALLKRIQTWRSRRTPAAVETGSYRRLAL